MLIIYDKTTGAVLDNTGTNSAMPVGPPDSLALVNLPDRDPSTVGLLRLHDLDDADLVAQVLANRHHVDPATGEVLIDGPHPEPEPVEPEPSLLDRLVAVEAEVRGMKSRAAAEAAKASPTAKGVAAAVAADSA